jgi:hypothetical protein
MAATTDLQTEFVDLYRAGLQSSLEFWQASLEVERLQNQQLADLVGRLAETQLDGMLRYQLAALARARAWLNRTAGSASP